MINLVILRHRQDHLQCGYINVARVLPWLHEKLGELDHEDFGTPLLALDQYFSTLDTFLEL